MNDFYKNGDLLFSLGSGILCRVYDIQTYMGVNKFLVTVLIRTLTGSLLDCIEVNRARKEYVKVVGVFKILLG